MICAETDRSEIRKKNGKKTNYRQHGMVWQIYATRSCFEKENDKGVLITELPSGM